jgi:hypothetical protein
MGRSLVRVKAIDAAPTASVAVAFVCKWMHNAPSNLDVNCTQRALMAKTSAISVRVPDDVKAAAEKAAVADSRSVASLVEKLLTDFLKANGYLKK